MSVSRTALRYYGGKAALADWIVSLLPAHEAYLEPFGGGASILLNKPRVPLETYNDLDGAVVAFFRVLRDDPGGLERSIALTPFAREEIDGADVDAPVSDREKARRLYVRSWQSIHGAPSRGQLGWRCEKASRGGGYAVDAWVKTEQLAALAARLRGVQIEHRPALEAIARFDGPRVLHLVDPPYVAETRGDRWSKYAYTNELDERGHRDLAAALKEAAGMVVLCGYDSPLYAELYGEWVTVTKHARQQSRDVATECLWLNPAAASAVRQRPLPLDLSA